MRIANTDVVDKFYEYDIFFKTRTIYMGEGEDGVDKQFAEFMIKGLHILDQEQGDITILMNNGGGDEYHGMAVYDAIKSCKNHVTIKVYGMSMSMGSIILQAADERMMSENARMMIHYGTWGVYDHALNSDRWNAEGLRFNRWMEDLYLEKIREKKPRYTRAQVKRLVQFDTFFTASEAVEIGLCDKVIG